MTDSSSSASQIAANVRAHDKVAKSYERTHGEIYNPVEQARLRGLLAEVLGHVRTESAQKVALDFGCGAGNLTTHLSSLGCEVVASDVSTGCLDLVMSRRYPTKVSAFRLNGQDIIGIPDASIDMVVTYSVLHHVPDYLGILSEFSRVLKPGGVVLIDHEASQEVWSPTPERLAFVREVRLAKGRDWKKYFRPRSYINWVVLKFIDPRYRPEGDIHVFSDDHIEWDKIAIELSNHDIEVICSESYLLFRRGYREEMFEKYKDLTRDTRYLIGRKSLPRQI